MDHSDLISLFLIAQRRGLRILPLTEDDSYMPHQFVENARIRVREHLVAHPEHREDWKWLGYDVDALLPLPKPKLRLKVPQAEADRLSRSRANFVSSASTSQAIWSRIAPASSRVLTPTDSGVTLDAFRIDSLPGVLPATVTRSRPVNQVRRSQARPVTIG